MVATTKDNNANEGALDDAYVTREEYQREMELLLELEGDVIVTVEDLEIQGLELLEELENEGGMEGLDSDENDSYANDSMEMNMKRVSNKPRKVETRRMARRASTGSVVKGDAFKPFDATIQPNPLPRMDVEASGRALRRFSNCAA